MKLMKQETKKRLIMIMLPMLGVLSVTGGAVSGYTDTSSLSAHASPAPATSIPPVSTYVPAQVGADGTLDSQMLKNVLAHVGFSGDSLRTAWALAMRESGGTPGIVSEPNSDGTRDYGLFQINDIQRSVYSFDQVLSAEGNAKIAYELSEHGRDFGSWAVGTTGWGGQLKQAHPQSWEQLRDTLAQWQARYPE